jgi:hypothetical protein
MKLCRARTIAVLYDRFLVMSASSPISARPRTGRRPDFRAANAGGTANRGVGVANRFELRPRATGVQMAEVAPARPYRVRAILRFWCEHPSSCRDQG